MSDRDALHKWAKRWPRILIVLLAMMVLPVHVAAGAYKGLGNALYEIRFAWNIDKKD